MSYTQTFHSHQDLSCAVEILGEDVVGVEIATRAEVQSFLDNIPEPLHVIEARWRYIDAWKSGAIGAVEALNALEAHGCIADAEEFMAAWVAGTEARLQLGSIAESHAERLAENPPCHPTAPEPHRAASPTKELLDAVAGARISRGRAA